MRMADVTLDDIQLALVPVSEKSASVYKSVVILYKSIFRAAKESKIIDNNPTIYLTAKGGGVPQKDKADGMRTDGNGTYQVKISLYAIAKWKTDTVV